MAPIYLSLIPKSHLNCVRCGAASVQVYVFPSSGCRKASQLNFHNCKTGEPGMGRNLQEFPRNPRTKPGMFLLFGDGFVHFHFFWLPPNPGIFSVFPGLFSDFSRIPGFEKMKKDEKTFTNLTQVEIILHKPFSRL